MFQIRSTAALCLGHSLPSARERSLKGLSNSALASQATPPLSEERKTWFLEGLAPESPSQNQAVTGLYIPNSLDSGPLDFLICSELRMRLPGYTAAERRGNNLFFGVLLPESQGQNQAVTGAYIPNPLDSGPLLRMRLPGNNPPCTLDHEPGHPGKMIHLREGESEGVVGGEAKEGAHEGVGGVIHLDTVII